MNHPIKEMILQRMNGISIGMYSVCSANEFVIQAAMMKATERQGHVLVEATANQVNQFGGYTGMEPTDFYDFVTSIAQKNHFPIQNIVLGGDHLGPLVWKNKPADEAMQLAEKLVEAYVLAGFSKIHLDTSMKLGGDSDDFYQNTELIAKRGAMLCQASERAFVQYRIGHPEALEPVYVIGSEVPVPGGAVEETGIHVTTVSDFEKTLEAYHRVFHIQGLDQAWNRVVAVVVQPGVEFGDETVHEYHPEQAQALKNALAGHPGIIFEGHSTDYQTPFLLREMVKDGIAILKVGPALTYSLREALFLLEEIERNVMVLHLEQPLSRLSDVLEEEMLKQPEYWEKYYHGTPEKQRFSRKFSFSDRIRYYIPFPNVIQATNTLMTNLKKHTPSYTLLSQFLPIQYRKIRAHNLVNDPVALLLDYIEMTLEDYEYAIEPQPVKSVATDCETV